MGNWFSRKLGDARVQLTIAVKLLLAGMCIVVAGGIAMMLAPFAAMAGAEWVIPAWKHFLKYVLLAAGVCVGVAVAILLPGYWRLVRQRGGAMKRMIALSAFVVALVAASPEASGQWGGAYLPSYYNGYGGGPSFDGRLVGGVLGGAAGSLCRGRNSGACVAAGAAIGYALGSAWDQERAAAHQAAAAAPQEVCQWVYDHTGAYSWRCSGQVGPRPHPGPPQVWLPAPPAPTVTAHIGPAQQPASRRCTDGSGFSWLC